MYCRTPYPTIPAVYDPDLSDEEKVILLMALVQNLSDTVSDYISVSPEWLESYVVFQIIPVQETLTALSQRIEGQFDKGSASIAQMMETVQQYTDEVMIMAYVRCIEYVGEMTDDIIHRLDTATLENVLLRNVVTGEMNVAQQIINDLASLHQNAPSAAGYDALDLTAAGFDALELNAFTYDFEGVS